MGSAVPEELLAGLLMIAFIGGFVFLIYKLVLIYEKKLAENFKKLGNKYGLQFEKDTLGQYGRKKGPLLKGNIKGHDFICYSYTTGGGKNRVDWTTFKLQHNLSIEGYRLRLVNEHIFRKIGKGMGVVKEIEIGVQDFDKRFIIDSENLSITRSLLNRNVREKITEIPNMYFGELLITDKEISYKVSLALNHEKTCKHFQTTLEAALLALEELKRVYR